MDGSLKESDSAQKRTPLEDLSKEDLVKKCKGLLVIAQRAKQAKDEATEEMKRLKQQLNSLELEYEKINKKEGNGELEWKDKEKQLENKISTMEEMLSSLTDQKLKYTMEVDNLKKQNLSLEKQLKQFKIDEAKVWESSVKLQAKVVELETAAESYKRQNNRLSDENEALIQQMETLESDMRKKEEQFSGLNSNQIRELEIEVQVLHDELDCLKEEDSRKKEQMKELYENFSKEKTELQRKLKEEQNKNEEEVQNLTEELKTLSCENEKVLADVKSVTENNSELQKLVEAISSERDKFNQQCNELHEEKKLFKDKLELLESEKKTVINSNVSLEKEKCQLNELVENFHKEIASITDENNLLKAEKEELNTKLRSVLNEREKLNSEVGDAECNLLNLLHQLDIVLQENKILETGSGDGNVFPDKQSNSLCNIISLLNEKLTCILSFANSNVNTGSSPKHIGSCYFQRETGNYLNLSEECKVTESEIKYMSDANLQARNYFTKLYTEITLLDSVISNLETQGKLLHSENFELKKSIDLSEKSGPTNLHNQAKIVPVLNENICMKNSCDCCSKITQLTSELESYKNNSEIGNAKWNCSDLENCRQSSDIEEELRKELNHCRQCLSQKNVELGLVQEELSFVLGKQREFEGFQRKHMDGISKETLKSNRSLEEKELEIDKLKEEILNLQEQDSNSQLEINRLQAEKQNSDSVIENMTCVIKNLKEEVANLNADIKNMQQDILIFKEKISELENEKLKIYNEKVETEEELTKLKQELLIKSDNVEEQCTEVIKLKKKLSDYINSEIDMNAIVERLQKEMNELKNQLSDKCSLVEVCNSEIQTQKEISGENKELENYICKLKKEIDENSNLIQKKDLELKLMKTDITELNKERDELKAELKTKSESIVEKEAEIETMNKTLKTISNSLEMVKNDLEDKVQKFETEAQNLKFLFDEKNIELSSAKDEIRHIRENSVIISKEDYVEMSELQSAFRTKENEIETLRSTLLKTESNLAQTLVKISESEAEYLTLQNYSENLKKQISELNVHLEEKVAELSKLQLAFNDKCSEINNVSKISQDTITEVDELRNNLKQYQLEQTKVVNNMKAQLLESKESYRVCIQQFDVLEIQKEKLQNDFKTLEDSYAEKTKELENSNEKFQILLSQYQVIQEELKVSYYQIEEIKKEVHSLKEANKKLEEDLRNARISYDDKIKELENMSSELVNVENASAEAFGRLTAMTLELDSAKEVNMTSTRKLDEMAEELKDATTNLKINEAALQDKLQELEEIKNSNEFLNLKSEKTKTGLEISMLKISELKNIHSKLSEDVQALKSTFLSSLQQDTRVQLQKIIESIIQAEIAIVKKENAELLGEMNEMNQVLKQRGETISKLKEMNNEQDQQLKECNSKIDVIQDDLKSKLLELESKTKSLCDLEVTLSKLKESHQESMLVRDETIKDLEKEVKKFKECQHELETKTLSLEAKEESIHKLQAELTKQKQKLQELEYKNKVITDLEKKIETLEEIGREREQGNDTNVVDDQKSKIKEMEDEVSALKTKIQLLEREAEEMRKDNGDAPSEIMSSSTISKAEESARLKDLEETFEERYTKLRTVAVRLKKKVSELTAQQTQLEADKKKLSTDKSELQAKITQLSAQAKNLQTMQQEYDRLQDELESQKTEVKQLTKTLEAAVNESLTIKVQLQDCQQEKGNRIKDLEICSKDKQNLEAAIKDLASQIQTLKKEKDSENIAKKEREKEIKRLQEEVNTVEKKLADEIDRHKSTQEQLEIRKQECKKRSVLSLEMDDYERSVADLTQQLNGEKSKVKELESHLDTQRDISRGLQEQISLLEQRIQSEEARSKEVKDQLNAARTKLSELEAHGQEYEILIADLNSQIEHHRDKSENLVLQLSELAAEKQRLIESGRSQQDGLTRQVHVLEEYVSRLKENLAERETELGDLRAEFGNYKVRAQSVLRQKARPEEGTSMFSREDCMEELSQLRQTADILRSKLEDASGKLQTLTVENSAIQEDRARVLQRCQELVDTVQDLRIQNSQLQKQLEEMSTEHREALKSQKLQAETLNQCYKQQLEEMEDRLQKETTSLKKQLQEAEKHKHGLEHQSSSVGDTSSMHLPVSKDSNVMLSSPNSSHWNNGGTGFMPVSPAGINQQESENRLEITMLEREEGEGSESVDSVSPHLNGSHGHRTELIPLDKLLSTPSEDDVNLSSTNDGSPNMEVGQTKEQLVKSECRIRHLTGLLSEAERDLAKLTQQNQVLKEEIRRQERSVEREQHAQNFEYLKNVVLKFVTLQGGDERSRLVPVLNTILKLSPEETNQLNIVAKGGPDLQGSGKGWSSYLSLWSGTQ